MGPVKSFLVMSILALAAGCSGSGGYEFREALVLYRSPVGADGANPVFIGFVSAGHSRYTEGGNVRAEIPGAKPLDEESSSECLEKLADLGFPGEWIRAAELYSALRSQPRDHVIVAEVDGQVHFLIRGASGGDAESRERLTRFVGSKRIIVDLTGSRSGYRIINNKEGASLFDRQRRQITGGSGGGKR